MFEVASQAYSIQVNHSAGGLYTAIINWPDVNSSFDEGIYSGHFTITNTTFTPQQFDITMFLNNRTMTPTTAGDIAGTNMELYLGDKWNLNMI